MKKWIWFVELLSALPSCSGHSAHCPFDWQPNGGAMTHCCNVPLSASAKCSSSRPAVMAVIPQWWCRPLFITPLLWQHGTIHSCTACSFLLPLGCIHVFLCVLVDNSLHLHSMHACLCHVYLWQTHYKGYFQTDSFPGVIASSDNPCFCPQQLVSESNFPQSLHKAWWVIHNTIVIMVAHSLG